MNVGLVTNIPTAEYLSAWQVLGNLEIAEVLLASALHFLVCTISHEPVGGF